MKIFCLVTGILLMLSAYDAFSYYEKSTTIHQCSLCFSKRYIDKSHTYALGISIPFIPRENIQLTHTYDDYKGYSWIAHNHDWVFIKRSVDGNRRSYHSHGGKLRRNFVAQKYEEDIAFRNFIKQKIANNKLSARDVYKMLTIEDYPIEKQNTKLMIKSYYLHDEFEKQFLNKNEE